MIRAALEGAGGQEYLQRQAEETPTAFLMLLAKCLPKDVTVGAPDAIVVRWSRELPGRDA